jgi:hypothetical protein
MMAPMCSQARAVSCGRNAEFVYRRSDLTSAGTNVSLVFFEVSVCE